jgi:RimJ/RimL family protein N-acetyltransferase
MFVLKQQVQITSPRLLLRPFVTSDIPTIALLANDRDIADNTLNIPYPYSEDDARLWLELQAQQTQCGDSHTWAITLKDSGVLVGAISLTLLQAQQAETGYWIGREFRNLGYCSEALQALIRVAADTYHLTSISAVHLRSNPASGRVMHHAGMQHIAADLRPDSQGKRVPVEIYCLVLSSSL